MKPTDEQLRDPKWWDENAPEWDGEGLPPVGCECECITEYGYLPCKVVDHGHDYVVVHFYKNEHNLKVDWTVTGCRPLLTKEQRQREELIKLAHEVTLNTSPEDGPIEATIDAILSRYNLEPKQ